MVPLGHQGAGCLVGYLGYLSGHLMICCWKIKCGRLARYRDGTRFFLDDDGLRRRRIGCHDLIRIVNVYNYVFMLCYYYAYLGLVLWFFFERYDKVGTVSASSCALKRSGYT